MMTTPDKNAAGPGTRSAGRGLARLRSGAAIVPVLLAMALTLSACDAAVGLYRDITGDDKNDPGPDAPNTDALAAGASQPYPNLASVPNAPTRALTAEQRDRLTKGLVADRTNAIHTDQQIRAGVDINPPPTGPAPRMGPDLQAASLPAVAVGGATPGASAPPAPSPPPVPSRVPTNYVSPLGATETVPASASTPSAPQSALPSYPAPTRAPRGPTPLSQTLPDLPAPSAPPAAPSPDLPWASPPVGLMRDTRPASPPPVDAASSSADTDAAAASSTPASQSPAATPPAGAPPSTTVASIPSDPGTSVAAPPVPPPPVAPPRRETDLTSPDVRTRPGAETPNPPPPPPVLAPLPQTEAVAIPAPGQVQSAPASPGLTQSATPVAPGPEVAPGGALRKTPPANSVLLGQVDSNNVDKKLIGDVAQLQKEHGATIRLIGRANRGQGADAANQQLTGYQAALSRANAVAAALTGAGVPANKIVVEAAPVRSGTAPGDTLNRTDVYAEF